MGTPKQQFFLCEHQLPTPRFWYVQDPSILKRRIEIQDSTQLYLLCIACKGDHVADPSIPQQSYYVNAWEDKSETKDIAPSGGPPSASIQQHRSVTSFHRKVARKLVREIIGFVTRFKMVASMNLEGPSYAPHEGLKQSGIHEISLDAFLSYQFDS
jgi:hypothetical protein